MKLYERKFGLVIYVKVIYLNFFILIYLSDSFCVVFFMFYIEILFFLECNDYWGFFLVYYLILMNDFLLFFNFYLFVIYLYEFIFVMYSLELI